MSRIDSWLSKDGDVRFSISILQRNGAKQLYFPANWPASAFASALLRYILESALRATENLVRSNFNFFLCRKTARFVLMGGYVRQRSSLMSGTNVWLKLLYDKTVAPTFLLHRLNKSSLCITAAPLRIRLTTVESWRTLRRDLLYWEQTAPLAREIGRQPSRLSGLTTLSASIWRSSYDLARDTTRSSLSLCGDGGERRAAKATGKRGPFTTAPIASGNLHG